MSTTSYKILSIVLSVLVLIAGAFFVYEKYARKQDRIQLSNQISNLEGTIKETDTAYSKRGLEIEGLRSENEQLQNIINERDEEIVAISELMFSWKDKYFKIKNAQQTIIPAVNENNNNEVIEVSADCQKCLAENRVRVDFEHEEDPFLIKGFTLTSPAEAELTLKWTRALRLGIILTKNEEGTFRLYVDPKTSDVGEAELSLKIDPEVFALKWFEKIGIGCDFSVGEDGVVSGVRIYYDILDNLYIGPNVVIQFSGLKANVYYGAVVGFYPFRGW